jgi:hypothetical protein
VRSATFPVPLPPIGDTRPRHKLALALEVFCSYRVLRSEVRRNDLRHMVRVARTPAYPRVEIRSQEHYITARRLGIIVQRLLALLPTDKRCLIRSLVLLRLLEQRTMDAVLVIGVRRDNEFTAHAWVEHQGVPVLPAGGYEPLIEL